MSQQPRSKSVSPCDSLSPLDDVAKQAMADKRQSDMFRDVIGFFREEHAPSRKARIPEIEVKIVYPKPQPQPTITVTAPETPLQTAPAVEAAPASPSTNTCEPRCRPAAISRLHRPPPLDLTRTNGLTFLPLSDLRQRIDHARTSNNTTIVQVPRSKAEHLPKTPATPSPLVNTALIMGNNVSSAPALPLDDRASVRSTVRRPVRMLRKGSASLLFSKRVDSKSPLPTKPAAAPRQAYQPPCAVGLDGPEDERPDQRAQEDCMGNNEAADVDVSDESPDAVRPQSDSPATVIHDTPRQTPSKAANARPSETDTPLEAHKPCKGSKSEPDLQRANAPSRTLALSPSIPAPSPLPEDSPHKYGLLDRMDTPDFPTAPQEIHLVKPRRRSTGPEVFHEAQSLQSASSFLNSLSASRRRAENIQRTSDSALASHTTTTTKTKPRPRRPTSALNTHNAPPTDRFRSHNFKHSGFAYSRPLTLTQLKCYREHSRLVPSRNKLAPVECAVCHIDDDAEHFSCSWCALRMCRFCRREFDVKGVGALKERVRLAELGGEGGLGGEKVGKGVVGGGLGGGVDVGEADVGGGGVGKSGRDGG